MLLPLNVVEHARPFGKVGLLVEKLEERSLITIRKDAGVIGALTGKILTSEGKRSLVGAVTIGKARGKSTLELYPDGRISRPLVCSQERVGIAQELPERVARTGHLLAGELEREEDAQVHVPSISHRYLLFFGLRGFGFASKPVSGFQRRGFSLRPQLDTVPL